MKLRIGCVIVGFLSLVLPMAAQTAGSSPAAAQVPPLVNFSGVLADVNGKPLTGVVGVTFSLYKEQQGGSPLWLETQNVQTDKAGHYTAALGSTSSHGLPASVFASGEARWLAVQIQGQAEQPRVLLMSVPYALKALDAETIGGKPASSFMLTPAASGHSGKPANLPPGTITGTGTAGFIPVFTGSTTIANSKIFQTIGLNVGVGTATPAAKLDVAGTDDIRDTLTLFPKLTHPTLSVHGTAFAVSSTGKVTFIASQTFPGTGTVTSVGLSAPSSDFKVSGSPVTSSGTLALSWEVAPTNSNTANAIVKRDANGAFAAGGITSTSAGVGVVGQSSGTNAVSDGVDGVTSSFSASGVAGINTGLGVGVYGTGGTGVQGVAVEGGVGVLGTAVVGHAAAFENNSADHETLFLSNNGGDPFIAFGPSGRCYIDGGGSLYCSGSKNAVVPIDGGKRIVAMSAIESPKNWFEDFGSAELSGGSAVVTFDPDFIQTVNTGRDYMVIPVPNGECKGLYVTNKTPLSFEVRELGGGTSSIRFDYRIVALRKNYENVRFSDHTNDPDPRKMMERIRSRKQPVRPAAKSPIPLVPVGSASSLRSAQAPPGP